MDRVQHLTNFYGAIVRLNVSKKYVHMQTCAIALSVCVCIAVDTGRSLWHQFSHAIDWIGLNAIKCRYDIHHTLLFVHYS